MQQLPHLEKKNSGERSKFWERAKILQGGSLVSLVLHNPNQNNQQPQQRNENRMVLFAIIEKVLLHGRKENAINNNNNNNKNKSTKEEDDRNDNLMEVIGDRIVFTVRATNSRNLIPLVKLFKNFRTGGKEILMLSSTSGYFEAYVHVLKSLQNMSKQPLPFCRYLVHDFSKHSFQEMDKPLYLENKSTQFNLRKALKSPDSRLYWDTQSMSQRRGKKKEKLKKNCFF